ncbi:MAG TPA: hypothetical protein VGM16_08780 [Gammaproteobacteria bacterium]|jgi:hypothetical protein
MSIHRLAAGVLLAAFACSASAAAPAAAPAPSAAPHTPLKVLLLPSDIKIITLGVASTEEATDDSARMTAATDAALHNILANSQSFKLLATPTLSADEQAVLKQHVALYHIEAEDAYGFSVRGGVWKDALEDFDYSIGPGLAFLKQRSGADYGLVVFGGDGESTGANLFFGNRVGRNHLYGGLIDLATGNVLWLHHGDHNSANFTAKNNMEVFVDQLIQSYPKGSVHDSSAPR